MSYTLLLEFDLLDLFELWVGQKCSCAGAHCTLDTCLSINVEELQVIGYLVTDRAHEYL